ncbi:MAG: alpha-L-fucosidase [Kiritimatiellae bacterium]|nr:alpha-L-fucosidase [Kiritimatiellia bacterium]
MAKSIGKLLVAFGIVLSCVLAAPAAQKTVYEANWDSLNSRPCPAWWKDAKFGIFIHWGVYSVPAFAPYDKESVHGCYAEHYGNPKRWERYPQFPAYHAKRYPNKSYSDLAADFTAAEFNPKSWVDLIKRSGAKYVVLTSKHHDGFALWPSACSPHFNAGVMGPKRDICGDLTEAVKAAGLHMGFYYSLLDWNHPFCNTNDINKFVEQVNLPQLRELVERYRPDIVWTDGEWDYPWPVWRGPEFLSWLYNESPVKDTVVVNDRWGKRFRGNCGDHYTTEYEDMTNDGKASDSHPWEECRGIGLSFGYNKFETTEHYLSNEACIETLCDKVSRGGNLLLNIGPTADGLIPVIMEERLLAIGKWLSVNGEAIYGTKAWEKRPKNMKKSRVYFTQKGDVVYAIVFGSAEKVVVPDADTLKSVSLLGSDREIKWTRKNGNAEIEMPAFRQGQAPCDYALVFKLVY